MKQMISVNGEVKMKLPPEGQIEQHQEKTTATIRKKKKEGADARSFRVRCHQNLMLLRSEELRYAVADD